MHNLAKPHNTYKKRDEVVCRVLTVGFAPPKGYTTEEHYGSVGKAVEKWSTGELSIGSVVPQLWKVTAKIGHLIHRRDVRGFYYYPGYDVALCLVNQPKLANKNWFNDGTSVGFWGTIFTRIKDDELCVAVLSMKGKKLVCKLKSLSERFDDKHRIIVAG